MEVNIKYKNYPEELDSASMELQYVVDGVSSTASHSITIEGDSEKTLAIKFSNDKVPLTITNNNVTVDGSGGTTNTTTTNDSTQTVDIIHSMNKEDLLDYIELLKKFACNIN